MRDKNATGICLAGALTARVGDETSGPALLLAGFALAGSTAEASALLAGISLAAALGGPVLGALLDGAARPGRLLAGAVVLYAAGLTLVLVGLGRLPFAVTVATAVLTGLLGPALSGSWSAQLPRVTTSDRLPRANALDTMTFGAAALAGPALAGGLAETLGAPTAVVVSAALIAAAAPAAWLLPVHTGRRGTGALPAGTQSTGALHSGARPTGDARTGAQPTGDARTGTRGTRALPAGKGPDAEARATRTRDIRAARVRRVRPLPALGGALVSGTRTVLGNQKLARATLTSVLSCVAQGMLTACVPLLGEQVLGGAGRGAVLFSCAAISALAVNALLARFPLRLSPDALVRVGALVQAGAPALALTGRPVVLVAAFLLSGIGEGPQLTALFAVRHRESPDHLRSQIFTTGASLKITGFALGAAAAGPLATWSLPAALTAATAVALLAAGRPRAGGTP
ncbi:MFS transporter [Streptomyces tanashiensis]|uniref:MFS transporter n=1 Tax=Streptomyces tanashiensis TaxID=67367 RepID=UPI001E47A9D3|nr:MFS transporter [Streptomyces tanashiensis]